MLTYLCPRPLPTLLKQGVIKGQLWEGIVKLFQEVGSQQQPNNEQITITGEDGETAAIVPVR